MKRLTLLLLIMLVFVHFGCSEKEALGEWKDVEKKRLEGTIFETDSLLLPVRIVVSQPTNLFAIINRSGKLVSIYNLENGVHVKSFVRRGDGPGELLQVGGVQFLEDGIIAVLGSAQKKFYLFSLESVLNDALPMPTKTISLAERNITQPRFVSADMIADTRFNFNPDSIGRLNFFNVEGKNIKVTGDFPETEKAMSPVHLTQSYNAFWDNDEQSRRIVLSHTYTDMIEVYDDRGALIKRVNGPDFFEPKLGEQKIGDGTMHVPYKGSKVGYFANRVGPKGILALYSGDLYENFQDRMTELIFFDLEGTPKFRYQLDIPIFHFDVDWENQTIYALSVEVNQDGREFAVLKYKF